MTSRPMRVKCLEALIENHQEIPEILLSDLNMPGMSGLELLSVICRRFPTIRVIALSGAFSGNQVPCGVTADAFYEKGNAVPVLLKVIERLPIANRQGYEAPEPILARKPPHSRIAASKFCFIASDH